jgi:hypothetical protein
VNIKIDIYIVFLFITFIIMFYFKASCFLYLCFSHVNLMQCYVCKSLHHAKQIRCTSVPRPSHVKVWRLAELRALTVLLIIVLYFILSWTPFSVSVIDECVANITPDYSTTAVFIPVTYLMNVILDTHLMNVIPVT